MQRLVEQAAQESDTFELVYQGPSVEDGTINTGSYPKS